MVPTLPPVAARLVNLETLIITIELMATIAFAMSGLMEAVRKRMDVVGVFSVTFVSAFGGGTLRDVLLNRRTFFWVQHQEYVWLVLLRQNLLLILLLESLSQELTHLGNKGLEFQLTALPVASFQH